MGLDCSCCEQEDSEEEERTEDPPFPTFGQPNPAGSQWHRGSGRGLFPQIFSHLGFLSLLVAHFPK